MRSHALFAVLALITIGWYPSAWAQTATGTDHVHQGSPSSSGAPFAGGAARARAPRLPLAIDGRLQPERISDELAFRHFVMAAATRTNTTPERRNRGHGVVARVGLSAKDNVSLDAALKNVRERLDQIAGERQSLSGLTPIAVVDELRERERSVLDQAAARVKAFLTPAGRARLEAHLRQRVKRNIVVYGDLPR